MCQKRQRRTLACGPFGSDGARADRETWARSSSRAVGQLEVELDERLPARIHGILAQNERLVKENAELKGDLETLRARARELQGTVAQAQVVGTLRVDQQRMEREVRVRQGKELSRARDRMHELERERLALSEEVDVLRQEGRRDRIRAEQALIDENRALSERAEVTDHSLRCRRAALSSRGRWTPGDVI